MITINLYSMYINTATAQNWTWIDNNNIPLQFLPYTQTINNEPTTILGVVPCTVSAQSPNLVVFDTCQVQFRITGAVLHMDFLNYVAPFSGYALNTGNYYSIGINTNDTGIGAIANAAPSVISFMYL